MTWFESLDYFISFVETINIDSKTAPDRYGVKMNSGHYCIVFQMAFENSVVAKAFMRDVEDESEERREK
jgi:hypothetical protein